MTEYPKAYATDLHAPGLRGLRRSSGKYDEPRLLRRRTGSRIESSAHLDNEHFSDKFRGHAPVLKSFSYDTSGTAGHCKLDDYTRLELFNSLPPTVIADSNPVSNARLPTPIEEVSGGESRLPRALRKSSSDAFRVAPSCDSYYSSVSADSATTVVPPGASIPHTGTILGPMDNHRFTQQWPKPPALTAVDIGNPLDNLNTTETDLRKSVGAVSLESGIDSPGGVLKLQWFDRWANFKWCLLLSVLSVFIYGISGLVCAFVTWFRIWKKADVMFVTDYDILIFITLASLILIFAALTGLTGALLSSRSILVFYFFLLWSSSVVMCAIGYTAYNRSTFTLEQTLDLSWSHYYTPLNRLMIQNALRCCGWSGPSHEGIPSGACFPRTSLPGCKGLLLMFEQTNLQLIWATICSLVPMHLLNIFVVMLCVNHVTRAIGEGMAPKRRRLMLKDVSLPVGREGTGIGGVRRPGIVRVGKSMAFGEARGETVGLLEAYFDEVKEQ